MVVQEALPPLVSALKLRNILKLNSFVNNYRIIEANVGENFKYHFVNQGHVEKAVYLNTMQCAEPSKFFPRNLPNPKCFQDYVGSLGIGNKHHLIIYDRSPFGFYASSRIWWIFRLFGHEKVSILNGGLRNWVHNNFELSTQPTSFEKEDFQIVQNRELIRDFSQIKQNINSKREQVIDVRSRDEFEKVDDKNSNDLNHIPLSKNIPYNDLFDENSGTLKDTEKLNELFKNANLNHDKNLIASCMTGMTACSLAFAAHLLRHKNVSVYYGSWTEYSQRKNE